MDETAITDVYRQATNQINRLEAELSAAQAQVRELAGALTYIVEWNATTWCVELARNQARAALARAREVSK